MSSAAAISYNLVVASSSSWSSSVVLKGSLQRSPRAFVTSVWSFSRRIHWKCFGLKPFKTDEWDFSLEISEIHLNCRVRNSPCDVPSEVLWHPSNLRATSFCAKHDTFGFFVYIWMECWGPWNRKHLRRGSRVWFLWPSGNQSAWERDESSITFPRARYAFCQTAMHE